MVIEFETSIRKIKQVALIRYIKKTDDLNGLDIQSNGYTVGQHRYTCIHADTCRVRDASKLVVPAEYDLLA